MPVTTENEFLECGEKIDFRGTDVLLFNLLEVTSDVAANRLGPRTIMKGTYLAEKQRNNENVIYLEDPNWKNSSVNYAHVSRDVDDNVVTVSL